MHIDNLQTQACPLLASVLLIIKEQIGSNHVHVDAQGEMLQHCLQQW